jgi:hypothetical protein
MIINARSPYFVTVNESGQVGSKIELRLWNDGSSRPTVATYTFAKSIASTTQRANVYNISPYIREYIDNVAPDDTTELMWVNVEVKRFKETSVGTYGSALDTTTHAGVNGYTLYTDGYNKTDASSTFVVLANPNIEIKYKEGIAEANYPYVNVYADVTSPAEILAVYKDKHGRNEVTVTYDTGDKGVLKIPFRTTSTKYNKGNTLDIKWRPTGEYTDVTKSFVVTPICESKYTPVVCQFINRFGGWQFLTFFKAQTNSIQVQGTTYKLLPSAVNYDTSRAQTKSINVNGMQSIRLNTGWVNQNYNELIQDLMLSETILLDGVPVEIKTSATDLKTSLKDRNINYEMEFEYAFSLINNVI